MGDSEKAEYRKTLARFYQVDDSERNTRDFVLGKPRVDITGEVLGSGRFSKHKAPYMTSTGEPSPPMPTSGQPVKKELSEAPLKFDYKIVEKTDNQGRIVRDENKQKIRIVSTSYKIEGSVKTEGDLRFSIYEYKDARGRVVPEGRPYQYRNEHKTKVSPPELYPSGTTKVPGASGAAAAVEEWNKWATFAIESEKATKRIAEKDRAFYRNTYPIPPEPKDLPRIKLRLERDFGKQKAAVMMKSIEEMSYAVWGGK